MADIKVNQIGKYDDIINLPHHISKKHHQMSLEARAAQFAPFAALTGYDDAIKETSRQTNTRIDLDEDAIMMLDAKLQILREQLSLKPSVEITYFVPDDRKDGGKYVSITGKVTKIDEYRQKIILEDNIEIPICEIIEIIDIL